VQRNFLTRFLALVGISFSLSASAGDFPVASASEQTRLMLELRAEQFLNRATFGATDSTIASLANDMQSKGITNACTEWIDRQFALAPSLHVPTALRFMQADNLTVTSQVGSVSRYRHHAWWHQAITAPDQLKQRLAWALSQICVVSETAINDSNFVPQTLSAGQPAFWLGLSSYYDMLLKESNGSYRDVLLGVTYHPQMGLMLSSLQNPKANPSTGTVADENYAREIMQLFSIGLYELNIDGSYKLNSANQPIPTYDNDTVQEMARAFTGLAYASSNGTSITSGYRDYVNPMRMINVAHDMGSKRLLNGRTIPAYTDGNAGVRAAVDNIYAHPNVAPFISRLLIQRFVMSNPSKSYIARVARVFDNNGRGVKGDFRAVMKAILTDQEAWASIQMTRLTNPLRLRVTTSGTEYCKLVEPVVQYASFMRRYGVPRTTAPTRGRFLLTAAPGNWGQAPFRSSSVFNFYLSDHRPSGSSNRNVAGLSNTQGSTNIPERGPGNRDLFAPEFQLFHAVVANAWHNRLRSDIVGKSISMFLYSDTSTNPSVNYSSTIDFNFALEESLAHDAAGLVRYLDRVLCNGAMTEDFKSSLVNALTAEIPEGTTANNRRDRVRGALITVMNSPYYLVRF
jgi:uncharacterized protein (DUF1800 family)